METKTSPRDVFLHLLAIASLYISAVSLVTLLFQYINYWHPDVLSPFRAGDAIRWAIASLLIIFPVHVIVVKVLHNDFVRNPEKRNSRLRNWLLYLTLFLAAIAFICDLVALIYNFLAGELTARFLLKVLAVALVSGGVFGYYWWELRRSDPVVSPKAKTFLWSAVALVLLTVIGGFFITGSPFKQRLVRLDQERVMNLQEIQYQVLSHWQTRDVLPDSLDQLRDEFSGFVPPVDPETGASYEYRVVKPNTFELCATFSASSSDDPNFRGGAESYAYYPAPDRSFQLFEHKEGRTCFERTIDPERYRIQKPL